MPFTFECGVCHAVYRLEENQITPTGVKITCPKCLNYFFLKRGGTEDAAKPVVEFLVPDGIYDVSTAPPSPSAFSPPAPPDLPPPMPIRESDLEEALDQLESSPPAPASKTPVAPLPRKPPETTRIEATDFLVELPPDPPKPTGFDRWFLPLSVAGIGVLVVLVLSLKGWIQLPAFIPMPATPTPVATAAPNGPSNLKHGFPQVETTHDPWTGQPLTPTPSPPTPAPSPARSR